MGWPVDCGPCTQCGEPVYIERDTQTVLLRTSQTFHCVHGHPMHYPKGKSEADKLRDQLAAERRARQLAEQRVAQVADEAREAQELAASERRRANAYKGHASRITKRAKAGVCPCCNRTFRQLARHMATQHPTFTPLEIEQVPPGESVQ